MREPYKLCHRAGMRGIVVGCLLVVCGGVSVAQGQGRLGFPGTPTPPYSEHGRVLFINYQPNFQKPVFLVDGFTPIPGDGKYVAQLWVNGSPASAAAPFGFEALPGIWSPDDVGERSGDGLAIEGTTPGEVVSAQIVVWNRAFHGGAELALVPGGDWRASDAFELTLGDAVVPPHPDGYPGTYPGTLENFDPNTLSKGPDSAYVLFSADAPLGQISSAVPEPGTIALAALGGACFVCFRRRSRRSA
jgi:hypothetical protein